MKEKCNWKKNNDGQFETECKEIFEFSYFEDFKETKFKYCPFCGAKIKESEKTND